MTDDTDAPGQPATPRNPAEPRRTGKRRRGPSFITRAARDSLTVSRAFGTAYERDGVRVIPVARVMGGTGSGYGDGYGGGGGFGTAVKPLGAVVIDDSGTRWQPAIDVNRAILGGQVVVTVAVLTAGWVLARRRTTVHRLGLPALPSLPLLPRLHRAQKA